MKEIRDGKWAWKLVLIVVLCQQGLMAPRTHGFRGQRR
jgi:hypothetical protein